MVSVEEICRTGAVSATLSAMIANFWMSTSSDSAAKMRTISGGNLSSHIWRNTVADMLLSPNSDCMHHSNWDGFESLIVTLVRRSRIFLSSENPVL